MKVPLTNIMSSVLARYNGSLYNAALTKLIYLIDMESVRRYGFQVSSVVWLRNNYGPFVWDVYETAINYPDLFEVVTYEGNKRLIVLKRADDNVIQDWAFDIVTDVVNKAPNPKLDFLSFKNYVYSTPPMVLSEGNGPLYIVESIESENDVELTLAMMSTPEWDEAIDYLAHH